MLKNHLIALLKKIDLILTDAQIEQLLAYVDRLNKWNKTYNLTSVREPDEMLIKHIIDSLVVLPFLQGQQFIDVGTGPGLPGIPLAIAKPDCHFYLVDSLGKRIRFLKQVKFELGLSNIEPVQARIETFTQQTFDGVISRAFASINDMLSWCAHLSKPTGTFYALKGTYPEEELAQLPEAFKVIEVAELFVPELVSQRHLVIIKNR